MRRREDLVLRDVALRLAGYRVSPRWAPQFPSHNGLALRLAGVRAVELLQVQRQYVADYRAHSIPPWKALETFARRCSDTAETRCSIQRRAAPAASRPSQTPLRPTNSTPRLAPPHTPPPLTPCTKEAPRHRPRRGRRFDPRLEVLVLHRK